MCVRYNNFRIIYGHSKGMEIYNKMISQNKKHKVRMRMGITCAFNDFGIQVHIIYLRCVNTKLRKTIIHTDWL